MTQERDIIDVEALLQPGDVLVFDRSSAFNWIIRVKTWSRYTHVEVVDTDRTVVASRNGQGCGEYPLDLSGIALVLRPIPEFFTYDRDKAIAWFRDNRIYEQGYDWLGLLNFTYARFVGPDNGKMFCSELATRFLRAGGIDLFPRADADTIAPRDLALSPLLDVIHERV